MFKKLLTSFLIAITLVFSLGSSSMAQAQALWYNQSPFEWYAKVYDDSNSNEIFGERYTASQVQWIAYSAFFLPVNTIFSLLGVPPTPFVCIASAASGTLDANECLKTIPTFIEAVIPKIQISSTQQSSNIASDDSHYILKKIFTEDREFSGITYVRNTIKKLNPNSTVKAATEGFGYNRLGIILPLWKTTRNIAYSFFVLASIIAAFMIMFKIKISPQAVITIQSAIPKIIAAMILVTFSYAIAGFVVDLIYVAMGIFSQFFTAIFYNNDPATNAKATFDFINGWTPEGFINVLVYSILYWVCSIVAGICITILSIFKGGVAAFIMGAVLLIFLVIMIIILIVNIFIGLFQLFKTLALFYVEVILGPIKLALGALPMSKGAFGGWLKALLSKALVFPVMGVLWYFGFLFLFGAVHSITGCDYGRYDAEKNSIVAIEESLSDMFSEAGASDTLIYQFTGETIGPMPGGKPVYTCWGPPLLRDGGTSTAIAFLLISISCILMIAKTPKMIESAFAGKPFDMGSAIGEVVQTPSQAGSVAATYRKGIEDRTLPPNIGKIDMQKLADKLKWLQFMRK